MKTMRFEIPKPLVWVGSSKKDLKMFPKDVMILMGTALYYAQKGDKHPDSKPLKGFTGAKVLEIVDDYKGSTYRAVYTVKLKGIIYVLHCFQKKSKKGISTPKKDLNLINSRLQDAIFLAKNLNEM